MLIEFTPPASVLDARALRLLNLAAESLFGEPYGDGWLKVVELPKDPPSAPYSPKGPSTSRRSAQVHAPRSGTEARMLLSLLWKEGDQTAADLTAHMQAHGFPFISRNQVGARLNSLRASGWVEWVTDSDGKYEEVTTQGRHRARLQSLSIKSVRMLEATNGEVGE